MIKPRHNSRIRIAFAHMPGEGWTAGLYYLRNLFYALKSLSDEDRPQVILLVDKNSASLSYDELIPFVDEVIVNTSKNKRSFLVNVLNYICKYIGILNPENPLSALLRSHDVDVFFSTGAPPLNFRLPFLSWIPDFQHLHYPHFFSEREIGWRNISFEGSALRSARVVLSSRNSFKDFSSFAPWAVEKARVLSFVAQISKDIYQKEPQFVCKKYNIPERFILLPNQFWEHKNHQTVIRALQIALNANPELTIVCTGNTYDNRNVTYFSKLLCLISVSGVRDRIIILGLVPHEDLFYLIRQSVAVLQPSLFEGWNTTIEEVKSLGKRLILSDIPVHREQDAPGAVYFPPTDESALACLLTDIFVNGCPGPDNYLEECSKKILPSRTERYGRTFVSFAREVLGE